MSFSSVASELFCKERSKVSKPEMYKSWTLITVSEVSIKGEDSVLLGLLHVGLLVLSDALLEEVSLASEGDHVHPLEWVLGIVELGDTEGVKKSVSNELDVLAHQAGVHANQLDREGV